jgi:hypothetical protein
VRKCLELPQKESQFRDDERNRHVKLHVGPGQDSKEVTMARWMIGDIAVDRVHEIEGALFRPQDVFPDFDPEVLEQHGSDLISP